MKRFKQILLAMLLILSTGIVKAQVDTVFWFAAPWVTPDHDQNTPMAFHFSTFNNPTTIRLYQPASVYDTTFTVAPNTLFSKYVSHLVDSLESAPADSVIHRGFKIESDFPIIAVYDFISDPNGGSSNNPETYSLKGSNGMGVEFVTPFQTLWNNRVLTNDRNGDGVITQPKQYFSVVATEDNTTIYITPRCDVIGGHPANVTYSVFLPLAGQVYTCENLVMTTSNPGSSLAGSIVVSDKPVSVTVNDDSVNPSGGGGCFDLMGDQIVPVDVIGTEYIINKGFLNAGSDESIFVVATENFTNVSIDNGLGVTTTTLNRGDTYQYSITEQLTSVSSDKNVYLLHMSGYGCELGKAILPPLNCAGSDQVSFTRTNGQSFLLDIIVPAGSEGDFTLNGSTTLIPAAAFAAVPGTGGAWMGAQIDYNTTDIPINTANLVTNSSAFFGLGIINGGPTTGCLYHYISSFYRRVLVDAGADSAYCTGQPTVNLQGTVEGGTITGIWTTPNGSGTLNNPTSLNTSYIPSSSDFTQGTVTFILESTGNCIPVQDTMVVTFNQSPTVDAGLTDSYCDNNISPIALNGTFNFSAGAQWSGGNGGSFTNSGDPTTDYTPSPADINADSVTLYFTTQGSLSGCPDELDSVTYYFTAPPTVDAGSDIVTCSSVLDVALNGIIGGSASSAIWTSNGSGSFSAADTILNADYLISPADTAAGQVILTLTSTNNGNCIAESDDLTITILDRPEVSILNNDSVCANVNSFALNGTVTTGYSIQWNTSGSGSINNPAQENTTYNVSIIDTAAGFIDLFLQTTGGICPVEEDSLRIFFVEPPRVNAGVDQDFCDNETIQLSGTLTGAANSASWTSTGTGSFNPSPNLLNTFYQPSPSDVNLGQIELILTSSADFGCLADDDTLVVTFKESPVADFTFSNVCFGENTLFTDQSSIGTGSISGWTYYFGTGDSSIAANPNYTYPGSGTYNASLVVESSNGCFDTLDLPVTINPVPLAMFNDTIACQNVDQDFVDASFISSGAIVAWDWDFNLGQGTSNNQNTSFNFGSFGQYPVTLTVTSDLGCEGSVTQVVDVLEGPYAAFNAVPNPALVLEDITFTDQSINGPIVSWLWDFGDGGGGFNQNEVYAYEDGGEFQVVLEVTDTNGCVDTAFVNVGVGLLPVLPTAFTPNGDGENDIFIIRGGPFDYVDFKIYNNWGEIVFQTDDPNEGWDGTYQGNDAQIGVYSWTFTVRMAGNREFIEKGDVTLIR